MVHLSLYSSLLAQSTAAGIHGAWPSYGHDHGFASWCRSGLDDVHAGPRFGTVLGHEFEPNTRYAAGPWKGHEFVAAPGHIWTMARSWIHGRR